jgi:ABC-type multidrug transport system ATPase subunit
MKITDLTKSLGRFSLYIDRLEIEQGRTYGLVGPNGSGKTTAMKLIAGLIEPDSGNINYEGLAARDITMAPRKPYFLHDSVYKNLVYPLMLRGIEPREEDVDYWLEIAGLKDQRRQYAPSLSSGEQQKLALVRAMIFSPKVILLDEAFSNLDMESAGSFERMILERQNAKPITWIIISHQLSHILRLCEMTFFMLDGRLEEQGPTGEMLLKPRNPHLQRYLQYETLKEGQAR